MIERTCLTNDTLPVKNDAADFADRYVGAFDSPTPSVCRGASVGTLLDEMFDGRRVNRSAVGGYSTDLDICRKFGGNARKATDRLVSPPTYANKGEAARGRSGIILRTPAAMVTTQKDLDKANPTLGPSEEVCYTREYLTTVPHVANALLTIPQEMVERPSPEWRNALASSAMTYSKECEVVFPNSTRNDIVLTPGVRSRGGRMWDGPSLNIYIGGTTLTELGFAQIAEKHVGDEEPWYADNESSTLSRELLNKYYHGWIPAGKIRKMDMQTLIEDVNDLDLEGAVKDALPKNTPVGGVNIYLCGGQEPLGTTNRCLLYKTIHGDELRGESREDRTHPIYNPDADDEQPTKIAERVS